MDEVIELLNKSKFGISCSSGHKSVSMSLHESWDKNKIHKYGFSCPKCFRYQVITPELAKTIKDLVSALEKEKKRRWRAFLREMRKTKKEILGKKEANLGKVPIIGKNSLRRNK